jgi:hypothetical protein
MVAWVLRVGETYKYCTQLFDFVYGHLGFSFQLSCCRQSRTFQYIIGYHPVALFERHNKTVYITFYYSYM